MDEMSVDAIAVYLHSPQSSRLRFLDLRECKLSGRDAATLFESMGTQPDLRRDLRISLSGNPLETGHEAFVRAVTRDKCPSQVVMQLIDYHNEDNFQRLLDALARNTTVTDLDISRVSLPSEANEITCQALGRVFSLNTTLQYLDISGEETHLVASNLGSRLNTALYALKHNSALKVLRIENQRLGLQGASTLASVLEENKSLQQIHCEGNEISLQAFTVLVQSLERNKSVLYLPDMTKDRAWAQKRIDREVENLRDNNSSGLAAITSTKASVRRTLGKTISGQKYNTPRSPIGSMPAFNVHAAVGSLSDQWDREVARLNQYLTRNYNLAHGLPLESPSPLKVERSGTSADSITGIADLSLEKTPKAELDRQLGDPPDGQNDGSGDEGDDGESPLEMRNIG